MCLHLIQRHYCLQDSTTCVALDDSLSTCPSQSDQALPFQLSSSELESTASSSSSDQDNVTDIAQSDIETDADLEVEPNQSILTPLLSLESAVNQSLETSPGMTSDLDQSLEANPTVAKDASNVEATPALVSSNEPVPMPEVTSAVDENFIIQIPKYLFYKLVFDNINKTVKPRFMRSTMQTQSLNYVQIYSVRSRIDFSSLSLTPKSLNINNASLYDEIIPSEENYKQLKKNFAILVA